jgi:hypothetical protein
VERLFKMLHDKAKNDPIDDHDPNDCILNCVNVCDVVHCKLDVANGSVTNVGDGFTNFTSTSGSDDNVTRTSGNESDVDKIKNEQRDDDT